MKSKVNGISNINIAVGVGKIKTEYIAFCKKRRATLWNSFCLLT